VAFGRPIHPLLLGLVLFSLYLSSGLALRLGWTMVTGSAPDPHEPVWIPLAWAVLGGAAVYVGYSVVFFVGLQVHRRRREAKLLTADLRRLATRRTSRRLLWLRAKRALLGRHLPEGGRARHGG
jgi:hypothetical protein